MITLSENLYSVNLPMTNVNFVEAVENVELDVYKTAVLKCHSYEGSSFVKAVGDPLYHSVLVYKPRFF